jgi:hypothetical protein
VNLNTSNLSHPRMQWEIESALRQAAERSRANGIGIAPVKSASGQTLFTVMHDRQDVPAFSFWQRNDAGIPSNITLQITKALREQAKTLHTNRTA